MNATISNNDCSILLSPYCVQGTIQHNLCPLSHVTLTITHGIRKHLPDFVDYKFAEILSKSLWLYIPNVLNSD